MKLFATLKLKTLIIFALLFVIILGLFFITVRATSENNDYIKWIDFNVTYPALEYALKLDIDSHNKEEGNKYNWIEILAYISAKYGGSFSKYRRKDIDEFTSKIDSRNVYPGNYKKHETLQLLF